MTPLFHIANTMILPPAMFFAWNFYRYKGREIRFRSLWISITLLTLTTVITSLQFIYPEIIPALQRDGDAMMSGQLWRLITPLFIQPMGLWQCFFNAMFFISFVPLAEHLYGRSLLIIYFVVSMIGQLIILYWQTTPGGLPTAGGGSSTALYAVMGALLTYAAANRKSFPTAYLLIPISGFLGAIILLFFEDGHAPALLMGGICGLMLHSTTRKISDYPNAGTEQPRR